MNTKELRAKSIEISNQARALLDTITPENRSEKEAEFERMMADSDGYANQAKQIERAEARSREFDAIETNVIAETVTVEIRGEGSVDEQRARSFSGYLRGEVRAQSIANDTGTKGGVLVPTNVQAEIIKAMRDYGPFVGDIGPARFVQTADGAPVKLPYSDNTAGTASAKSENAAASAKDQTISAGTLTVSTFDSGLFQVSNELVRDSVYDIERFVVETCAENLGYKANKLHTDNLLAAVGSGKTATSATAITGNELLQIQYAVNSAYRKKGSYMFNSNTELAIRLLVDADGKYLWAPALSVGNPDTLHGKAYYVNDDMPDMAAGAEAIAFGLFDRFWIRRAGNIEIRRSDDLLMASNAVAFIGFMSEGSALVDAKAIKTITMAAS